MKVVHSTPWWVNKTLVPAGKMIELPDGTPVPAGAIVDGKPTPKRKGVTVPKVSKDAQIEELKTRLAELEAKVSAPQKGKKEEVKNGG